MGSGPHAIPLRLHASITPVQQLRICVHLSPPASSRDGHLTGCKAGRLQPGDEEIDQAIEVDGGSCAGSEAVQDQGAEQPAEWLYPLRTSLDRHVAAEDVTDGPRHRLVQRSMH